MPIYEYEPTLLSESDEVSECCYVETLQSFSEKPLEACPTCGKAIHRVISRFSFASQNNASAMGKGSAKETGKGTGRERDLNEPLFSENASNSSPAGLFSAGGGDSNAKRAAKLAMRHICATGCRH